MNYNGLIKKHTKNGITGWCTRIDCASESVDLSIYFNDVLIRRIQTYGADFGKQHAHFHFGLHQSLVDLLPSGSLLKVVTPAGEALQFDMDAVCERIGTAEDDGKELCRRLALGWVVDKWGSMKLPFCAMSSDQRARHQLAMGAATKCFRELMNLTLFPHYGTLLGYARSRSFLPHDDDIDMSVSFVCDSEAEAASKFLDAAENLFDRGIGIRLVGAGQFTIYMPEGKGVGTDVFLSWYKPETKEFSTYFGVNGTLSQPLSFQEELFEGEMTNIPHQYLELVAMTYGAKWQTPDPNFSWQRRISELEKLMGKLTDASRQRFGELSKKIPK